MTRDIVTRWFHAQREPNSQSFRLHAKVWPTMAGGRNLHLTVGRLRFLVVLYGRRQ